ncbi:hypothetical protein Acsp05_07170 [Actinokineospora sp. NBRC 105648]|nr:hypothetical protein Acsp05_07170 [Actinokineospora sp. NBRC 105648]
MTAANCRAINSAARWGNDDGAGAALVRALADWPTGTIGTPTSANRPEKSGGAHTRTSTPRARNRTASPTTGSTSPRDPYVDNTTRTSELPCSTGSGFGR